MLQILVSLLWPLATFAAHDGPWPSDACSARLAGGLIVHEIFEARTDVLDRRPTLNARRGIDRVELTRLAVAPHPIERVSVVVPIYRELRNGNVARLVRTLEAQGFGDRLRLVAVVNNTPEVAANPQNPILVENRQTVRFLENVRRRVTFPIEIVDETRGIARNMGKLRNRGLFRALELAPGDPRRHVIVNFDADAQMTDTYLRDLVGYYDHFPLDAILSRRGLSLPEDAPRELFQSHYHSAYRHLIFDLSQILYYPGSGASTPQITVRASVAAEMKGFVDWEENEDIEFGLRLGKYLTYLAPDVGILQSDRVREDGFDAARGLKLIRSHLDDDEYVPGEVTFDPVGSLANHLVANAVNALQTRTGRGETSLDEALKQYELMMSRFLFANSLHLGPPIDPQAELYRTGLESLLGSVDVKYKVTKSPVLLMFLDDGVLAGAKKWSSTVPSYLFHVLDQYLTPSEARALTDQWNWWRGEVARRAVERRADLRVLIETGVLPADAAAARDPFRAQLRRNTSLRRDVVDQIRKLSRQARMQDKTTPLSVDHVVERLMARYPDWLNVEWRQDRWVANVEVGRFLGGWCLEAMADPKRYPGTNEFLEIMMPRVRLD